MTFLFFSLICVRVALHYDALLLDEETALDHQLWEGLLQSMSAGGSSHDMLRKVLTRVALAPEPVSRSEIAKGSMLIRPAALASGTVGKAADALLANDLLIEDAPVTGQPGPPVKPLRLDSDTWAIIGVHVDQQRDGPDTLTGIICGLDRQPLSGPLERQVPGEGGQHDLRDLAEHVRELTQDLLAQLARPRRFLGIGVNIGGHVHHGKVFDSTHARWDEPVNLGKALREELGNVPGLQEVPVVVENDVNALAIHGYYERSFDGLHVALVAVFRQGIGGALTVNGRMYRGVHGMAPEPGHLAVEYPQDEPGWEPPPTPIAATGRTFAHECLCSALERKAYGHVDTLASPARIEGELAARKADEEVSLEKAAATPLAVHGDGDQLVFAEEAVVLRRAGRALGRGLAGMINIVNPEKLVLLLPEALARPIPQSSGSEYLDAIEREIDGAYSTGAKDARGGRLRLTVQSYADDQLARDGAVAAATTAFNAFIEHARGSDGCRRASENNRRPGSSQRARATARPA
jgi:predicted NBD/HSP70 family sugar kinase